MSRPIEFVVLKFCVVETNVTSFWSKSASSFAKSIRLRLRRSTL